MKNTKLIALLSSLSPEEMTRFGKYVHADFFNTHQATTRLFDILAVQYPAFANDKTDRRQIFSQVYPDQHFDDAKLRILRTYLLKLIYGYLSLTEAEQDPHHQQLMLFQALSAKGHSKYLPKLLEESENRLQAEPVKDAGHFYSLYQLDDFASDFELRYKTRSIESSLQSGMRHLDYFYLAKKLQYACSMLSRESVVAVRFQIPLLEEIGSYCAGLDLETVPLIGMYYYLLRLFRTENGKSDEDQSFVDFKVMLNKYSANISDNDLVNICILAINYCNLQLKAGQLRYYREMFELYQRMLDRELLFDASLLPLNHYKNIITLGIRLHEFDWTSNFIYEYRDKLDTHHREGVFHYNLANLLFSQSRYGEAKRHLQQVEFLDAYYRLSYNILLLKTYFECNDVEAFFSLNSAFRTYIRRNRSLSEKNRTAYINFTGLVRRVFKAQIDPDKYPEELQSLVESTNPLVEKGWLQEKCG